MCLQAVLSNWSNEFIKWAPEIVVINYDGSPDERKQLQRDYVEKGTFNILITHYDLIMRDKSALKKVALLYAPHPVPCRLAFAVPARHVGTLPV